MPPVSYKPNAPSGFAKSLGLKSTLKKLANFYSDYKKMFIVAIVLALIGGAASTAGIIMNGFLYSRYIIPFNEALIGNNRNGPVDPTSFILTSFIWLCVGLIVIYLISNGFNWLESYILLRMSEGGSYKIRNAVFTKLNDLSIKYFDTTPSGDIMSRTINDVDNIGQTLSQYLGSVVYWIFMIITMLLTMLLINPVLAIFAIILIPIFLVINITIMKKVKPYFRKQQNSLGDLNGFIEENVSGLKILSLFKMKDKSLSEFDKLNRTLTKNSIVAQATTNGLMPINIFMNNMSFVVLAAIGIVGMFVGGKNGGGWINPDWGAIRFNISASVIADPVVRGMISKTSLLIVFTLFARNLNNPINQLVASLGSIFLAMASASRVLEILDQPIETDDKDAVELNEVYGLVEAERMNFEYDKGKPILKDINFHVKPKQTVALVGPTGAGKTTIVNLITRFYDISGGDLRIDGISINKIKRESLRKNITMVLQDTFLFSTSIYENIRYGRLDATKEEIIAAAKMAHAHHFIELLPKGYDTVLEDNGSNLSQGQRQLLAIARAFLSNCKIVILDEATSSIDTKTEIEIQHAMQELMKDRTSFVIAHRLSTIQNADNIFVIKDGQIIENGKHQELLDKEGFYAMLYNSQFKKGLEI